MATTLTERNEQVRLRNANCQVAARLIQRGYSFRKLARLLGYKNHSILYAALQSLDLPTAREVPEPRIKYDATGLPYIANLTQIDRALRRYDEREM